MFPHASQLAWLAALPLLACLSLTAAQRDYWLKIERNGTPFAWEHITVTELTGGNLRYDYSHEIRVGTVGAIDRHEKSSYVVDRQLRPVSFTSWRTEQKGEISTSGARAGNTMTVTVRAKDVPEKRLTFDVRNVHFGCVLEDLIVRNARRQRFRLRLLDIEELQVTTSRVEIRSAADGSIEAAVKEPEWTVLYRLSRDGIVNEMRIDKLGVRSYRTGDGDARKITSLKDSLFPPVKSRNPFPNPFTVTRARVQVKWNDLRSSALRLEDSRQTLVRTSRSGDQYEAVVDLGAPAPRRGEDTAALGCGPRTGRRHPTAPPRHSEESRRDCRRNEGSRRDCSCVTHLGQRIHSIPNTIRHPHRAANPRAAHRTMRGIRRPVRLAGARSRSPHQDRPRGCSSRWHLGWAHVERGVAGRVDRGGRNVRHACRRPIAFEAD